MGSTVYVYNCLHCSVLKYSKHLLPLISHVFYFVVKNVVVVHPGEVQ